MTFRLLLLVAALATLVVGGGLAYLQLPLHPPGIRAEDDTVSVVSEGGHAVRSDARPFGRLEIKLPRFLSGKYWIYVDREIVSVGNLKSDISYTALRTETGTAFMDNAGVVSRTEDGRGITYIRENARESLFQTFTFNLSAGRHTVELAVPSAGLVSTERNELALTFRSQAVEIEPDETIALELCPPNQDQGSGRAVAVKVISSVEELQREAAAMQSALMSLESDPVVLALQDAETSPRLSSKVVLNLPEDLGGSRQFDMQQIRLILDDLKQERLGSFSELLTLPGQEDLSRECDRLMTRRKDARSDLDRFRGIVRRMERAAAEEIAELLQVVEEPLKPELEIPQRVGEILGIENPE